MNDPISVNLVFQGPPLNQSPIHLLLVAAPQREDLIFFEAGDIRLPSILAQKNEPIVLKVVQVHHITWKDNSRDTSLEAKVIRVTDW